PRTWACAIVYTLGQLNFLSDKSSQPHMAMADLCAAFGVGQSTAAAKAKAIRDALRTSRMDPTWMLQSFVDQNPLVWMAEVNGLLVDLRHMPREVQQIAYEKGMIPYIPADRECGPGWGTPFCDVAPYRMGRPQRHSVPRRFRRPKRVGFRIPGQGRPKV
ncbi:MAG: hypothetical protein JOY66_21055, partial [Acetobacteraceae bacterium]|nr:hypothetical protein [Acetobacteraceae bacterium]